jgi:hypothetical protein
MCGIFGGIGKNVNAHIIRALALANRERGTDSVGFFDSHGKSLKSADDALDALTRKEYNTFINRAVCKGWFIAGHTRFATHGKVISANAHPFRYGRIIGAHNGMCYFPKDRKYQVDSEYLFDQLNRHDGNYQAGLADVDGYWGLTWFDGSAFYIQAHDNDVYVGKAADGAWYYSSDKMHLLACIGSASRVEYIGDGRTIKFNGEGDFEELPAFKSVVRMPFIWNRSATATDGKRKKRKKSKKADSKVWLPGPGDAGRYGVTGHAVSTAFKGYDDPALDTSEYAYLDEMAMEAGYGSGVEFMGAEGFQSIRKAIDYLEFHAYSWAKNDDRDDSLWGNTPF